MNEIEALIRPNIKAMRGYSTAQQESGNRSYAVKLDANESPYGEYNRYPDSKQKALKSKLAVIKAVDPEQILISNGSDECIDMITRALCVPSRDKALSFRPGFGMYRTVADLNDVEFIELEFDTSWDIDYQLVRPYLSDPCLKLIFICNPNNPTGKLLSRDAIVRILDTFKGITVIDEAYIDFSDSPSCISLIDRYPRLLVMQTLSKSWSLAGARIGAAFGHKSLIATLEKIRFPYNVSSLNLDAAERQLDRKDEVDAHIAALKMERVNMAAALELFPCVSRVYESSANFLLVRFNNADAIMKLLANAGILVRDKSKECRDCLRITIGSPEENIRLINILKTCMNA